MKLWTLGSVEGANRVIVSSWIYMLLSKDSTNLANITLLKTETIVVQLIWLWIIYSQHHAKRVIEWSCINMGSSNDTIKLPTDDPPIQIRKCHWKLIQQSLIYFEYEY